MLITTSCFRISAREVPLKTLRIIFTLIAAVFAALVIPLGALLSWAWAGLCGLGAFLFFGLMLLCKQKQEENDKQARHADLSELNFQNTQPPQDKDRKEER